MSEAVCLDHVFGGHFPGLDNPPALVADIRESGSYWRKLFVSRSTYTIFMLEGRALNDYDMHVFEEQRVYGKTVKHCAECLYSWREAAVPFLSIKNSIKWFKCVSKVSRMKS